jgi:PAS domain S-box-containing protein
VTGARHSIISGSIYTAAVVLISAGVLFAIFYLYMPAPSHQLFELLLAGWIAATVILLICWLASLRMTGSEEASDLEQVASLQQSILDSAGPMILTCDLAGRFTVFNRAAERMLGYRAEEMLAQARVDEIFPEGEMNRIGKQLVESLNRAPALPSSIKPDSTLANYIQYVTSFPVSRARGFEMHFRRKDGSRFPAMVYISAVRNTDGEICGLLAISTDLSATKRAEHALRESQERYRDLFENSNEMIATLSPRGRYLYVNPAWQRTFGLTADVFESLISFESAFPPESQAEAAALFRRALNGERVDRTMLRLQGPQSAVIEVEASLSRRQEDDKPVSVRCIFRDVTQQRQRERRLAMQLIVSQIVGESNAPEEAWPRVLASLGESLGVDVAGMWVVDEEEQVMRFHSGWTKPGDDGHEFGRENRSRTLVRGEDLPGRIWALGTPCWIEDVREDSNFSRRGAARIDGLVSGWGIPVRVGNKAIAAVEFFHRRRQKEDAEMMATVETVCASLGQFMARSGQETQVRELNQQKEFILNAVADGIFGTDREGRMVFVNPAAAAMLGTTGDQLIGKLVHEVVHRERLGADACNERCPTRKALSTSEPTATGQDVFFRLDGGSFPVEFSVTPILDDGDVKGSVLSFRDISQRYALDRMKDEFVSTVSHELRTPLTSIRGALGLLSAGLMGTVSEKAANLLRIAVSNSDRLVRLINDILDLERMQSGRAPLAFRRCALNEVVQHAADAMAPMADAARIRIAIEAGPTAIEADTDRLLQVITNLLSNAIKFSPPDSLVTVKVKAGSEGVTVNVVDQGRGIPADKLETIFDRFQQVDASDSRQKGGTGLGLAICRTIVHQHGGRIWAERNPKRGSTFSVFLPFRHRREDNETTLPPMREVREGTILICDRDPKTRVAVADHLRQHGYKVVDAETGEQAIAIAHEVELAAILLDLSLPAMHGWQTLRLLKGDRATASVPVVVLSMLSADQRPELADDVEGWVQKPHEEETLLSELARVLRGGQEAARVLLVEDDEDLARVILATFERAGIDVHHAASRTRAIELCVEVKPDLLILDLSLPDGDGFNVVDWLRQQKELSKLPLVVYSARDIADHERSLLKLGPTEFLTKAKVQPQEVEALVLTMLRRFRDPNNLDSAPAIGDNDNAAQSPHDNSGTSVSNESRRDVEPDHAIAIPPDFHRIGRKHGSPDVGGVEETEPSVRDPAPKSPATIQVV